MVQGLGGGVRQEAKVEGAVEVDEAVGEDEDADDDEGDATDPEWTVEATARGIPLADVVAREVKAVTYSQMVLERRDGGWYAYVVLDV